MSPADLEDRLRHALTSRADSVEPREAYDVIERRVAQARARRRLFTSGAVVLSAAALIAAVVGLVALTRDDHVVRVGPGGETSTVAPSTSPPTTTSATTTPAPSIQAPTTPAPSIQASTTPAPSTGTPTTIAPATVAPTIPVPTAPSPTSTAPVSTASLPTTEPATLAWPAIWPAAGTPLPASAEQAALRFAVDYLRMPSSTTVSGSRGSTEQANVTIVDVRPSANAGTVTHVFTRPVNGGWTVIGSGSDHIELASPGAGTAVSSPIPLSGRSTAFEATINAEARRVGTGEPLSERIPLMGGSNGDLADFSGSLTVPATDNDVIVLVLGEPDMSGRGDLVSATAIPVRLTHG
jgi:hypothetical protein